MFAYITILQFATMYNSKHVFLYYFTYFDMEYRY